MLKHRLSLVISLALITAITSCGQPASGLSPTNPQSVEDDPFPIIAATSEELGEAWHLHTESGVSIGYPASWSVESTPGGAVFISPDGARVLWEISSRPENERALTDPNEWVPNEGGYEIHWSRKVTIPAAEGLEFIWGVRQGDAWALAPQLMAVLYSPDTELDIRLSTFFNGESIATLDELGAEAAVSMHFVEFEQMLGSIQIALD